MIPEYLTVSKQAGIKRLLVITNSFDAPFLAVVKPIFQAQFQVAFYECRPFTTFTELQLYCKARAVTHVLTTNFSILKLFDKFLEGKGSHSVGCLLEKDGLLCILADNFKQIYSVNHGRFMLERWTRKLARPEEFMLVPRWKWKIIEPETWAEAFEFLSQSRYISIDIETEPKQRTITSVSYAGISQDLTDLRAYVIDLRKLKSPELVMFKFQQIRKLNQLPIPKILQNGQYDCSYFLRFNSPITHYYFDTYNFQHCRFPELEKDLAAMAHFYLRNSRYWKQENVSDLLEYNAKDTINTLLVFLAQLEDSHRSGDQYAMTNYLDEFPMIYPCLMCAMDGLFVDEVERKRLRTIRAKEKEVALKSLETMLGLPGFNPGSWQQVLQLFHALGFKNAKGTDKNETRKFSEAHPLFERIALCITSYRKAVKAISNYFDAELFGQRMLYSLDPAGTESGRLASRSSAFWCGAQIQNQPPYCKSMYLPDDGWLLAEIDNAQSESRCTGYMAEDLTLIDNVENSPDFHCSNASLFFGIPFTEIFDVEAKKVLRPELRKLAKPVNHGANYNMGAEVLEDTMGTLMVYGAAKLLGLPTNWKAKQICEYLLERFHAGYTEIRGSYYPRVIKEIKDTGRLAGPTGWVRRTFLKPWKSKLDLNAAVAHGPQSLSVMLVNKAFYKVFLYQLETKSQKFRLKAQIHDSIFFQYRKKFEEEVISRISTEMKVPCEVNGRLMIIPNDPKFGASRWSDLKD